MKKVGSLGAAEYTTSLGLTGVQLSGMWRASVCHVSSPPWHEGDEEVLLGLCTLLIPRAQGATVLDFVFWGELGGFPCKGRYYGAFLTLGH